MSRSGALNRPWLLPPLILHPFPGTFGPEKILRSSRASLILQGILPPQEGFDSEEKLKAQLIEGRYCELSMLYYLGKDVTRWLDQCTEFCERHHELKSLNLGKGSFADYLIERPPQCVTEKLKRWGVFNHSALFARALGIYVVFADLPAAEILSEDFLLHYHRYADYLYACWRASENTKPVPAGLFHFELYASQEYARLLEEQWKDR